MTAAITCALLTLLRSHNRSASSESTSFFDFYDNKSLLARRTLRKCPLSCRENCPSLQPFRHVPNSNSLMSRGPRTPANRTIDARCWCLSGHGYEQRTRFCLSRTPGPRQHCQATVLLVAPKPCETLWSAGLETSIFIHQPRCRRHFAAQSLGGILRFLIPIGQIESLSTNCCSLRRTRPLVQQQPL